MNSTLDRCATRSARGQLLRYGIVGIVSNLTGFLIYLLLTYAGATPKMTMTFLYGVGAAIGYLGNRRLTFGYHGSHVGPAARYLTAHMIGYLINFSALWLFVDQMGYPHQVVQGLAILAVAAYLFVVLRQFVFAGSDAYSADVK